jgi:hypothetical protein
MQRLPVTHLEEGQSRDDAAAEALGDRQVPSELSSTTMIS